jgi:predicted secreted hydrolase
MKQRRLMQIIAVAGAFLIVVSAGWYALRPTPLIQAQANFVSAETLQNDATGYARVITPRDFAFPADHGPHPEYALEWWYYTGNLQAADGRRFGYQLTFFRQSMTPAAPVRQSQWGTNQAYLAHFAVTDVANNRFYATAEAQRGGSLGLAGATADPYRVFVNTWSAEGTGEQPRLRAAQPDVAIDLQLRSLKPPTLQGEQANGLSQKGAEPGNASYYYSLTHMATDGVITLDDQPIPVSGLSWMDHEFGTSSLGEGQTGWDWFGLHLDDGRDLMWGQLRREDGTIDVGQGSITGTDGTVTPLGRDDVQVEALDQWRSPHTGAQYPSRWRITIPQAQIELVVEPLINDQELNVGLTYWEGAVRISGTTTGYGYVELTGYGVDSPPVR